MSLRTTQPAHLLENERKPELYEPGPGMLAIEPILFGKTEAGLIVPGTSNVGPPVAKVCAIGPARLLDNGMYEQCPVDLGDHIVFGQVLLVCMWDDHGRHRFITDYSQVLAIVTRPRNISIKLAMSSTDLKKATGRPVE